MACAQESPPSDSSSCSERIEQRVTLGSGSNKRRDRLEITTYGPGRRLRLEVPGARDLCFSDCDKNFNLFAADDYTHVAKVGGQPLPLAAGEYDAEILPPDRQALLLGRDVMLDTGNAGAVVLSRKGAPEDEPAIVIHSGPATAQVVGGARTILMTPDALDRLIGYLMSARVSEFFVPWSTLKNALPADAECRVASFAPFPVHVVAADPPGVSSWWGNKFGAKVPAVPVGVQVSEAMPVSLDDINRAQLTAGMNAIDFLDRMEPVHKKLLASDFTAVAKDSTLSDEQRRQKLYALNEAARDTIAEAIVLLEGVRESLKDPKFTDQREDWAQLVQQFEAATEALQSQADNEVTPLLTAGDKGGMSASLWLPASDKQQRGKVCDLRPVERSIQLPPQTLQGPKGPVALEMPAQVRFWFSPVVGAPDTWRLNASVRADLEPLRPVHRRIAQLYVDTQAQTCNDRAKLRETDQGVSDSGSLRLKANVRKESWFCASYKYPCGAGLKGIKTCKENIRSRLYAITMGVRQEVVPFAAGLRFGADVSGGGLAAASRIDIDLAQIAAIQPLMTATELRAQSSRFINHDGKMWNAVELKGARQLDETWACVISEELGRQ
ncbi:hypothetical protein GCM10027430_30920 [Lysobacter tyrosinilyticus]